VKHSETPACLRTVAIASRIAKATDAPKNNGGSPTAFNREKYPVVSMPVCCIKVTAILINGLGISLNPIYSVSPLYCRVTFAHPGRINGSFIWRALEKSHIEFQWHIRETRNLVVSWSIGVHLATWIFVCFFQKYELFHCKQTNTLGKGSFNLYSYSNTKLTALYVK